MDVEATSSPWVRRVLLLGSVVVGLQMLIVPTAIAARPDDVFRDIYPYGSWSRNNAVVDWRNGASINRVDWGGADCPECVPPSDVPWARTTYKSWSGNFAWADFYFFSRRNHQVGPVYVMDPACHPYPWPGEYCTDLSFQPWDLYGYCTSHDVEMRSTYSWKIAFPYERGCRIYETLETRGFSYASEAMPTYVRGGWRPDAGFDAVILNNDLVDDWVTWVYGCGNLLMNPGPV